MSERVTSNYQQERNDMQNETSRYKLVEALSPGDVVKSDVGEATILSCERAHWIQVSGGVAFEIKYQIDGKESSCIQSSKDRLEMREQ